jgi:sodium-dependent dicarboxylate transporter 2/3/5
VAEKTRQFPLGGLPPMPGEIHLAGRRRGFDWKRAAVIVLSTALFFAVYLCPPWPDAVDPAGRHFALTVQGKGALALFVLAALWWVFEVVPIGVTGIAVGVIQALFLIRSPGEAFGDFLDPSVWFIFGSIVIGRTFNKVGLTQRIAYRMLILAGERTSLIYLVCFVMTAALTLVMAHTAAAATVFPLLMAVYALYEEDDRPTRFGKGLFIGMAFVAAAGSIVTLLGSARAAVAVGFFKEMAGREITFSELTRYMFPLGWGMVILLWLYCRIFFPPERKTIPGLRDRVRALHARLGPMSRTEWLALGIVLAAIAVMSLHGFVPAFASMDKSAVILVATLLFFAFKILDLEDLEDIPWNIVLLFGGAMSIGFCLWKTGAAAWAAIHCLALFQGMHWLVFVVGTALAVLLMTNFVVNVAVIAIALPVAVVAARYVGVAPEVVMFALLAAAGMPFMLLVGAAPNAIAFGSRQFTSGEFFKAGVHASLIFMVLLGLFVFLVWPLMGMPVLVASP